MNKSRKLSSPKSLFSSIWRPDYSNDDDHVITLPCRLEGQGCVDWGDGTMTWCDDQGLAKGDRRLSHRYDTQCNHEVVIRIEGKIVDFSFRERETNTMTYGTSSAPCLIAISSWGLETYLEPSLGLQFVACSNLRTFPLIGDPHTSDVTNMKHMFSGCENFDADLGHWMTSNATNMDGMFSDANAFTGQGLSKWDVGSVNSMANMFSGARSFEGDLQAWNTSKVLIMDDAFQEAKKFDCDLSRWDTSQVYSMMGMFDGALSFTGQGLNTWNTSKVEDMESMFTRTRVEADLGGWDTSNVLNMKRMFEGCRVFTGRGLQHWQTSNVKTMMAMFKDAKLFNGDVRNWDLTALQASGQASSVFLMLKGATSFTYDLFDAWDLK